ncbi:phenylalanine--tRNA ligase subunit beta [Ureaplasma ceti]|uniref:Phenylalanine--tRNA ligase beta subunit n=1 Tax=Ureaplasma ceti TaxID=3119530 RepID=A0ABP9U5C9_9BACT
MLLSRNLLNKINPKFATLSNEELTVGLNAIGVEVEEIITHKTNPGLRVGKIVSAEKHPDSDHLNVCQVELSGGEMTQIVCGAPNLPVGYKVVVAPIGYKFSEDFVIAERKLRGVVSKGMMCGYNEITSQFVDAIDKLEVEGLVRIDPEVNLTDADLYDFLGLNDTVLDLSLPSNRNELNGAYWLAYELNAYFRFNTELLNPAELVTGLADINVEINTDKVNQYGLIAMTLAHEYDYTRWNLKKYLVNSGIHVTNTLADYGNFLTLLFANPVHLFDRDLVSNTLQVTELKAKTKFLGLDNKEYELAAGTLVTMSGDEIVAAIGLMGSKQHAVSATTKNVLLEVANVNSDYFRNLAKTNKISSASSVLFSKPLSETITAVAFDQVLHGVVFQSVATSLKPVHLVQKREANKVTVSNAEINQLLGLQLSDQEIADILWLTGFERMNTSVSVPSYRLDINNVADICEEILKSIDINHFTVQPIYSEVLSFNKNKAYENLQKIRQYLVHHQFLETKTYNLTSKEKVNLFNWFNIEEEIEIVNPLSNQRQFLRHSLLNQMLEVLTYNLNHKEALRNIFEIQKIQVNKEVAFNNLTVVLAQPWFTDVLNHLEVKSDAMSLKALFCGLLSNLNKQVQFSYAPVNVEGLTAENSLTILNANNEVMGYLGTIKKTIAKEYGLTQPVLALSLNLDMFLSENTDKKTKITAVSEFNPVYKDFSFINPHKVALDTVWTALKTIEYVKEVNLIDTFKKDDQMSYTISLRIEAMEKTLSSEEIDAILTQVKTILTNAQLELR